MAAAPRTRAPRRTARVLLLLVAVVTALAMTPASQARQRSASPATAPAGARAMWVWTRPSAKTLVDFAKAHGVTDLFLAVPAHLPTSGAPLTWATSVRKLAAPAGIRLQALGGDPGWVDDPAAAVAWETDALSTGLFTGAHVDLEPWLHPQWPTDRPAVVRRYLDTLTQLQAATALPLEADVAFWLGTVATDDGTPLDTAVLGVVDRVTVMSYRTAATGTESITGVGATTLTRADAMGRPARLAVETNYLGSDAVSAKQTFYGSTQSRLTSALAAVDAAEAGVAAYAGVAVEDYAGWTALRP